MVGLHELLPRQPRRRKPLKSSTLKIPFAARERGSTNKSLSCCCSMYLRKNAKDANMHSIQKSSVLPDKHMCSTVSRSTSLHDLQIICDCNGPTRHLPRRCLTFSSDSSFTRSMKASNFEVMVSESLII